MVTNAFNKKTSAEVKLRDLLGAINEAQREATDDERTDFWDEIMSGYCRSCGIKYLPCFCINDE